MCAHLDVLAGVGGTSKDFAKRPVYLDDGDKETALEVFVCPDCSEVLGDGTLLFDDLDRIEAATGLRATCFACTRECVGE